MMPYLNIHEKRFANTFSDRCFVKIRQKLFKTIQFSLSIARFYPILELLVPILRTRLVRLLLLWLLLLLIATVLLTLRILAIG